jgi:hypothetical protein
MCILSQTKFYCNTKPYDKIEEDRELCENIVFKQGVRQCCGLLVKHWHLLSHLPPGMVALHQ